MTSAVVTLGARVLVAPGGSPARRGSSHCPSRSLWLIAAAILSSSGTSGSSSHVCGTSPVQTGPGGTWLAGVRSCTGHSGNCLSSQSSRFEVSTFSPHSGSACHLIFNCRLLCWPGVASLPCILPRNHTNCFGCPLSVVQYTPCTSAPSGHSGLHGGTFRPCEKRACWGLRLRLRIGWQRRWGHFGLRFGPFGPAG